jgi:probable phosphoglycerate mutase
MEPTRILAIRHGETAWNVDTRLQGHLDIPLNDVGLRQAQHLAQALAQRDTIDAIYASDLSRAHTTAQAIAQAMGYTVNLHVGLRERHFGAFQGRTFAEIEVELPEHAWHWRKRTPDWVPPQGGESLVALRERVVSTVNALAARHPGQQIVMVAHGGVLDILYRVAPEKPLEPA